MKADTYIFDDRPPSLCLLSNYTVEHVTTPQCPRRMRHSPLAVEALSAGHSLAWRPPYLSPWVKAVATGTITTGVYRPQHASQLTTSGSKGTTRTPEPCYAVLIFLAPPSLDDIPIISLAESCSQFRGRWKLRRRRITSSDHSTPQSNCACIGARHSSRV